MLVTPRRQPLEVQLVQTPFETEDGVGGFVVAVQRHLRAHKQREREAEGRLHDLDWIARIRDAMDNDRFVLHAQPIVEIATGKTIQHELLIRMLDDDGEVIPPAEFLGVAETYGLIGEIDRWVIRQAVLLAAEGHPVELNVSAHSLSDPTLYDFVDAELRREGADPGLLIFELTETALLERRGRGARVRRRASAERGCGLALDDFGTGYGGFSYLKRLPLDYLKIDIEFVRDLATDAGSRRWSGRSSPWLRVSGSRRSPRASRTRRRSPSCADFGVDYAQGYHTGHPAPLDQTLQTKASGPT